MTLPQSTTTEAVAEALDNKQSKQEAETDTKSFRNVNAHIFGVSECQRDRKRESGRDSGRAIALLMQSVCVRG